MVDRVLAEITTVLHFTVVAYVVFGGFLSWRWPKTIIPHALVVAWVVLATTLSMACPLTTLEDHLRRWGGQPGLRNGFIGTYLTGVLYPAQYAELMRWLVAVVVAISWLGTYYWWRRRVARRRMFPLGGGVARRRMFPLGGGVDRRGRAHRVG